MDLKISPFDVIGLPEADAIQLQELIEIYDAHQTSNDLKDLYYDGDIPLGRVNLGIALPENFKGLEIGCSWGEKTVDVLASRSMFDGFVGQDGDAIDQLDDIVRENDFVSQYDSARVDELKYGFTCATLSADSSIGCKIRFHSPCTAAAKWNGEKNRIACGFAIIDTVSDESEENKWVPSIVNYYTDDSLWVLNRVDGDWYATKHKNKLGRPMMEALIWNPTSQKPLGQSRLKSKIRYMIDGYIRTVANATIGLEFSTTPQKYILGVTDDQYDVLIDSKFQQYIGNILAATANPETGTNPVFGQLAQGSLAPHVEMLRMLSTQFSAATGLTVTDTGVVNDANPTSSDAILAQSQTLIALAEKMNTRNGTALKNIALMALAIANDTTIENLPDDTKEIVAHFRNPAMPSVAVTADAAIKIASVRQNFSNTDVFLEMLGFSKADIRRIKAQEQRARGATSLLQMEDDSNNGGGNTPTEQIDVAEAVEAAEETAKRTLNGAQTQSLIAVIGQFASGSLTENQAANIISTSIGISRDEALDLLKA